MGFGHTLLNDNRSSITATYLAKLNVEQRRAVEQELTDELLMPSGALAVVVLAGILIVIFFWKTSGLT